MLLDAYVNLMLVFSAVSVVLWLLGPIGSVIQPNCTVLSNWTPKTPLEVNGYFHLLYLTSQSDMSVLQHLTGETAMWRNSGIFTEAPMYAMALSVALLLELFVRKTPRKPAVALLLITVLTTISTTGIIISFSALYCRLLISAVRAKRHRGFAVTLILLVGALCAVAGILLVIDKASSLSGAIRMDDYRAGFLAWQDGIVFGNGFYTHAERIYMSEFRAFNVGFSNSIFDVLDRGGIVLLVPYLVSFVGLLTARGACARLMGLLYVAMWVVTIVSFLPITALMLSMGTAQLLERFDYGGRWMPKVGAGC